MLRTHKNFCTVKNAEVKMIVVIIFATLLSGTARLTAEGFASTPHSTMSQTCSLCICNANDLISNDFMSKDFHAKVTQSKNSNSKNANTKNSNSKHFNSEDLENSAHAQHASSCSVAVQRSGKPGLYLIQIPDADMKPFFSHCISDPEGGHAWSIIQRRQDGSVDFYRTWQEYKQGFGNLNGEFFIGLDKLHAITNSAPYELWIRLEDFDNEVRFAKYSNFAIGDESQDYELNVVGDFTGDAGDSFTRQAGMKYSTKDREHDTSESSNCAQRYQGAWWYHDCYRSHLNGLYLTGEAAKTTYGMGLNWVTWHGKNVSLKYVHMAIRPVKLD